MKTDACFILPMSTTAIGFMLRRRKVRNLFRLLFIYFNACNLIILLPLRWTLGSGHCVVFISMKQPIKKHGLMMKIRPFRMSRENQVMVDHPRNHLGHPTDRYHPTAHLEMLCNTYRQKGVRQVRKGKTKCQMGHCK